MNDDRIFIEHIMSHLVPGQKVICKICKKSADDILKEAKSKREYAEPSSLSRWGEPAQSIIGIEELLQSVKADLALTTKERLHQVYELIVYLESENKRLNSELHSNRNGE